MEQQRGPSARIWSHLPPELAERIAACLRPNEVAGWLRFVNKAAAAQFRGPQHTTIHLSQPVPPDAFARYWGSPGAARGLPLKQRRQLLCLTAASGSIPNLQVAIEAAGCLPTEEVLETAAAARQLAVCEWLLQRGCSSYEVVEAAARAGHRDVIQWLVARGCGWGRPELDADVVIIRKLNAARAAARGGHVDLVEWILQGLTPDQVGPRATCFEVPSLLAAAAQGCDLAALQRLHGMWLGGQQDGGGAGLPRADEGQQQAAGAAAEPDEGVMLRILSGAAASPTPDWRAKVIWLEGRGYPRTDDACARAAACPDAVDRLTWLRQRGYPVDMRAATRAAARAGNLEALQYLRDSGAPLGFVAAEAAEVGHLPVLVWLAEVAGVRLGGGVTWWAAKSGSVEMLTWLHERGAGVLDAGMLKGAACGGSEAALEWLVQRGCSMEGSAMAYEAACRNRDLATLCCLRRLGCPWGPVGRVFKTALRLDCGVSILRWLLEAGCPVGVEEVEEAEAAVRAARRPDKAELLALLAERRGREQRA